MRILHVVFTTFFCLVVAGFSFAQDSEESVGCPPYDDPYLTFDARPIVNAIDTNQDGIMTLEEWTDAGAPEASWNMFMEQDESGKGYISRYEFITETPPDGIDANCDGYITIWEFLKFAENAPPPPDDEGGDDDGGNGGGDDGGDGGDDGGDDDGNADGCVCPDPGSDCPGASRWPWRWWR